MKRIVLAITAVALALVRSDVADAQIGTATTTAACCQLTTSLGNDQIRGKDILGDERFFRAESVPPNIHFLIDTSVAMQELPQVRNGDHVTFFNSEPKEGLLGADYVGCTNSFLRAEQLSKGWDPLKSYPPPDTGTGLGSDTGFPELFIEKGTDGNPRFYSYMSWGDLTKPTPIRDSTPKDLVTSLAVCQMLHPQWANLLSGDALAVTQCQQCLDVRGFYKKPGVVLTGDPAQDPGKYQSFVFSGKFLNFNPPKVVTLRYVLKQAINDLKRVRAGMSGLSDKTGVTLPYLERGQNPPCGQAAAGFDGANRSSYVSAVNALSFTAKQPLIARALFNVGEYFSSTDSVYSTIFKFGTTYLLKDFTSSITADSRPWCWGCQKTSTIIISGAEPKDANDLPRTQLAVWNKGNVKCPDNNGDGQGDCAALEAALRDDLLDDVAKFVNTQDLQQNTPTVVGELDTSGRQSIDVYGISFGAESPLLRSATEKWGGGLYFTAKDASSLRDAILEALANIEARSTGFANASVANLQVTRSGSTVLPRLKPPKGATTTPWQGLLYRFGIDTEFRLGCVPENAATVLTGGSGDPKDLNRDGDCRDTHLLDKVGDAVVEDDEGNFVKLANTAVPAEPYWEAGAVMKCASPPNCPAVPNTALTQRWMQRRIWTIIDNGGPGGSPDGRIDKYDAPVEFTESNAAILREYLGLGQNPQECSALQIRLGLASLTTDECAALVIRYYRGADLLNRDPAKRDYDRSFLLHDVFHSAPMIVEPLTEKALCGFGTQCLETLFHEKALLSPSDAYDVAYTQAKNRDKIILVGSNGGMLHAFLAGRKTGVDPVDGSNLYDEGTGQELWAFIPPDLLPKLKPNIGAHAYFVDGTPMIRDVWIDGNGDYKKQADEFRTVAVVGEGSGGVHRFALDLTRLIGETGTRSHQPPSQKGDFLWTWPQPCDPEALLVGESSGVFVPKPPPIGPVAIKRDGGHYKFKTSAGEVSADERWIVFVNGGYDPYMVRGRGLAMIDIATGKSLWTFRYKDGTPNATEARHPFAAPVSMLDVGPASSSTPDQDLLFDTATVGDMGGSVWTVRFWVPGEVDPVSGKVTNWFAARSFEAQAADALALRPAFTSMTANALQPETGYLRTYVGTGDRYNLLDAPGAICRLSNPRACALQGCAAGSKITVTRGGVETNYGEVQFSNKHYALDAYRASSGGSACLSSKISVGWNTQPAGQCPTRAGPGLLEYFCDGSSSTWSCRVTTDNWAVIGDRQLDPLPTASPHRFYGFYSFGITAAKKFGTGEGGVAGDILSATAFDSARLTEARLLDVTSSTASATGTPSIYASLVGNGWYIRYQPLNEKTASNATILDGCVLWNSFEPSAASSLCSTAGTNVARFYQSGYVDGASNCAAGFFNATTNTWARYISRNVSAAPGEPNPMRSVWRGRAYTSIVTLEAGGNRGDAVTDDRELVQSVYHLEVDRQTHECRHEGVGCE